MWSVTRRRGEAVVLVLPSGEVVRIKLEDIGRYQGQQRARISVEAPREIRVDRLEVAVARAEEEETASHEATP